jgi:hypothetical protein
MIGFVTVLENLNLFVLNLFIVFNYLGFFNLLIIHFNSLFINLIQINHF